MRFGFTERQRATRDAARAFFAEECDAAHVRAMWQSDTGRSPGLWKRMAEVGLVGLTVPARHGGSGAGEVDLALVLEEAGYAALPEPLLETAAVCVPFLLEAGTEAQRAEWLPRIASGEAVVTVQLAGDPLVADAHVADLVLVEEEGELHAVPRSFFRATPQPSFDGARRLFTLAAETSAATRMAGGAYEAARAFDRAAAATAAALNGVSRRLLDMTVAHVKEQHRTGRAGGSVQAVNRKLAETHMQIEASRSAAWYAAYALAHDLDDRPEAASVAKAHASETAARARAEALRGHAGGDAAREQEVHLWLERAAALRRQHGSAGWHRSRVAQTLMV